MVFTLIGGSHPNTQPPFVLPPRPGWFGDGTGRGEEGNKKAWKIVSFDPWGAMSQEVYQKVSCLSVGPIGNITICSVLARRL